MSLHTADQATGREPREQTETNQSPTVLSEPLAEMGTENFVQLTSPMVHKKTARQLSHKKQYGIALSTTIIAFLIRLIADLYLGDNLPFVTFLIAIAVTTWYGGMGASLMALVLGGLLWNWFFIAPRYEFTLGTHVDKAAMTIYLTIGIAMIGYIQTWRWAWKRTRLNGQRNTT